MINKLLLVALILVVPVAIGAQQKDATADSLKRCSKKLISYAEQNKASSPVFLLDLLSSSKGLFYFGARHSVDPADSQFLEIEQAWNKAKPTIAFYEGPNRPIAATRDETIKQTGESGFVRFLAARDGIPIVSLEPSPQDEVNFLLKKFSPEQVTLFFVLRETARLRERRKLAEPELRAAVTQLLERASKMKLLSGPITNLDELDAAYRRFWKNPAQWWQAPSEWFDPLKSSADTGGVFTNEVNQMSSGYRDLHMYTVLSRATLEGKKVFAVVGRDHVAMQADALRCALKK
ncbi:MAG: hypothetical protein M3539_02790 [Acidobacteriota bacterium]|nr:hypothetical protein [Acidobacteriota bacterium]